MKYDVHNDNFLGHGFDCANHHLDAFRVNDEMHIVYNLNEETQYSAIAFIDDIQHNPQKYLWTPYIMFIDKI